MQTHKRSRRLRQLDGSSPVGRFPLFSMFGLLLAAFFGVNSVSTGAHVQTTCTAGDPTYTIMAGEMASDIAARYAMGWQKLVPYNQLAKSDLIDVGQILCILRQNVAQGEAVAKTLHAAPKHVAVSHTNVFPYGQCTWWANQRYHQIHGMYVPWRINSNAWQWNARALQFGWKVSAHPNVGDIMVQQPHVQGAGWLGHVSVVEQVLGNGNVITSSMNWYPNHRSVMRVRFHTGPGVSFIST